MVTLGEGSERLQRCGCCRWWPGPELTDSAAYGSSRREGACGANGWSTADCSLSQTRPAPFRADDLSNVWCSGQRAYACDPELSFARQIGQLQRSHRSWVWMHSITAPRCCCARSMSGCSWPSRAGGTRPAALSCSLADSSLLSSRTGRRNAGSNAGVYVGTPIAGIPPRGAVLQLCP